MNVQWYEALAYSDILGYFWPIYHIMYWNCSWCLLRGRWVSLWYREQWYTV